MCSFIITQTIHNQTLSVILFTLLYKAFFFVGNMSKDESLVSQDLKNDYETKKKDFPPY